MLTQLDWVWSIPFLVLTNQRETLVDCLCSRAWLGATKTFTNIENNLPSITFFSEVSRTYLVPTRNRRIPVIKGLQEKSQTKYAIADVSEAVNIAISANFEFATCYGGYYMHKSQLIPMHLALVLVRYGSSHACEAG